MIRLGRRAATRPPPEPRTLALDEPPVTVTLRRSRAARRFTLSVSRLDGTARLTLPAAAPLAEAEAFLVRQAGWLAEAVARAPASERVRPGAILPFRGDPVTLTLAAGPARRPPRIENDRLLVHGPAEAAPARALAFLKAAARDALAPAARRHAALLGRSPGRIALRDTRSRWGSCTASGDLNFCWRLVMAPPDVLDYVALHEAAHLVEMNHGPRFWALVERLDPGWRAKRDWLRREGPGLHRWRFDA